MRYTVEHRTSTTGANSGTHPRAPQRIEWIAATVVWGILGIIVIGELLAAVH